MVVKIQEADSKSEYRLFKYVMFNDKTIIFSYVKDVYFPIKLQQLI